MNKYSYLSLMILVACHVASNGIARECLFYTTTQEEAEHSGLEATRLQCKSFSKSPISIYLGDERAVGSYGTIFEGKMTFGASRSIPVVIKRILLKSHVAEGYDNNLGGFTTDPDMARNEFSTMFLLYSNTALRPYLVIPFAYFEYEGRAFIVMQDGGTPMTGHYARIRNSDELLNKIFRQIVAALSALHTSNIAHLDLHPDNILLDQNDTVRIIDFGFSRQLGTPLTVAGKSDYRDPQIYVIKHAYPEYDVFSLGAILFEIAHGSSIFRDVDTYENLQAVPIKPGNEKFEKFVKVHEAYTEHCSVSGNCTRPMILALKMMSPQILSRPKLSRK